MGTFTVEWKIPLQLHFDPSWKRFSFCYYFPCCVLSVCVFGEGIDRRDENVERNGHYLLIGSLLCVAVHPNL